MVQASGGFSYGWLDGSIADLACRGEELLTRVFAVVVISALDSHTTVANLPVAHALSQRAGYGVLGRALLVPAGDLKSLATSQHLFTGFDEVWCFYERPTIMIPSDVTLVAPLDLSADQPPRATLEWMRASGCALGLGDGIGLNYVTPDQGVARAVANIVGTRQGHD